MGQTARKPDHVTYGDYCAWDDDQRWELIDGEAFRMSPAPTRAHQCAGGGPPDILPTEGCTAVTCLPGIVIDWAAIFPSG